MNGVPFASLAPVLALLVSMSGISGCSMMGGKSDDRDSSPKPAAKADPSAGGDDHAASCAGRLFRASFAQA